MTISAIFKNLNDYYLKIITLIIKITSTTIDIITQNFSDVINRLNVRPLDSILSHVVYTNLQGYIHTSN